ncbi:IS4 family transposase [Paenibacillus sp. YYML68]|uniref:IS4 family transposase n=1 Tax=Paenibacillus sp. YYML68 TaxID=2909250 RepID=UPI0024933638|nr:IS4 family transposase [Paenibacillus sp. YYML68]
MDNVKPYSVVCQCLRTLQSLNFRPLLEDHRTHKLFSHTAVELHTVAQLLQLDTYDEITAQLRAHPKLQEAINIDSISSAQLSRKTNRLCTQALQGLFYELIGRIHEKTNRENGLTPQIGRLHIVDATDISLPEVLGHWARCGSRKTGVRLHVRLVVVNPKTVFPDKVVASTVNVREAKIAPDLVIDPDATYVMDRGYESSSLFQEWVTGGKRFVVRVRDRTKLYPVSGTEREHSSEAGALQILQDVDVLLNKTTTPLRLVAFQDEKGRYYRVVTTRWDLTAAEVASIYKNRWKIELFFKWIKQHLKLAKLHGSQPTSVWNQLFLSLIAFAVNLLVTLDLQTSKSPWQVLQLLRTYMFHSWEEFEREFNRPPKRPSRGKQKVDRTAGKPDPQRIILR